MKFSKKVVVSTGAGSGIGQALALELLARGASVAAVDISDAGLQETAKKAGDMASSLAPFVVNIADKDAVYGLVDRVVDRFGAVDGVINCAGIIQPFVRLEDLDYDAIDRVFDVNWRGTLYMIKAFLPSLLARPEAHIVNVSSMGGFLPVPGQTIYGASKAAVKLMTEGLHAELQDTNVSVTIVFPGAVATNIMENSGVTMKGGADLDAQRAKVTQADDAARTILDGAEHGAFRVLVGKDAKVMDKLYRLNPKRATAFIAKQMKALLS